MLSALNRTLVLAVGVAVLHSPAAHAIVVMNVGSSSVVPGGSAPIDVELTTHETVYSFEVVLGYDADVLTLTSHDSGELLEDWGSEGMTWSTDTEAGTLTVTGTSHGHDPIAWTLGEMLDLQFAVADEAVIGSTLPLTVEFAEFYDAGGGELMSFHEGGQITILDPEAEPEPLPPVFVSALTPIEGYPGDAVWLDIELDTPAMFYASVFELWVDGTMVQLDTDRESVIAERVVGGMSVVEQASDDVITVAVGAADMEVPVPEGTGLLISVPLVIPVTAEPGVRSILLASGSAIGEAYARLELTGSATTLTVLGSELGDTGEPEDTGDLQDTGDQDADESGETADTGLEEDEPVDHGGIDVEDEGTAAPAAGEGKAGCGCAAAPTPAGALFFLGLLGLVPRLRR
jgi:MYXO-CTERM domain-containing protein